MRDLGWNVAANVFSAMVLYLAAAGLGLIRARRDQVTGVAVVLVVCAVVAGVMRLSVRSGREPSRRQALAVLGLSTAAVYASFKVGANIAGRDFFERLLDEYVPIGVGCLFLIIGGPTTVGMLIDRADGEPPAQDLYARVLASTVVALWLEWQLVSRFG